MAKRIFDILLAVFGLLFFPLGVLIACLIKIQDWGTVFYAQERWGLHGRNFKAYKFRTMIPWAGEQSKIEPAEENDERITFFGEFLRKTAMDELPQLINILKGDMSFVGPRPLAKGEIPASITGFQERHQVRPGLTGTAQVYAPRDEKFEEKFQYDLITSGTARSGEI